MSEFVDFIEELVHDRLKEVDVGMVGRIESFDKEKMRADVTPLLKKKSGDKEYEYAKLSDVPVNFLISGDFFIRPEYKQGDLVHISFATHALEDALKGRVGLASERIFTSENAFIVGGVAPTDWSAPSAFGEAGLLLGHKSGKPLIKITENEVDINDGALVISK